MSEIFLEAQVDDLLRSHSPTHCCTQDQGSSELFLQATKHTSHTKLNIYYIYYIYIIYFMYTCYIYNIYIYILYIHIYIHTHTYIQMGRNGGRGESA